jgi:Ran GTPase-activating protein (RanGAP) involved in mRNA processing and transport
VLILVGCQLQSEGLITLLGKHKEEGRSHLFWKELDLASNNIGDEGAKALAYKLKAQELSSLQVLQLESNTISVNTLKIMVEEGLPYTT